VTIAATNVASTSFSANWNATDGATGYYLDVSINNAFSSCVTGWDNFDAGNVTTYSVNLNLAGGTTYYYRVRAKNAAGTSVNSNATTLTLIPPDPVATTASGVSSAPSAPIGTLPPVQPIISWMLPATICFPQSSQVGRT
jgi:hypothetical protein